MSKIKQDKIYLTQDEKGNLKMDNELGKLLFGNPNASAKYKLVRESDSLTKYGQEMGWVEWGEDGRFSELHKEPKIGLSCILDPHRISFTWLTTSISEIVASSEDSSYIKFNTRNSVYELWRLKND